MKTTLGKFLAALLTALLLMGTLPALGEARYPTLGGVVTDDANALSQTMVQDVTGYAATLAEKTGVSLHVALVLFLDGETAQTYANTLFTRWELGENDLLVLGAAAEDTFATVAGSAVRSKLSDANLQNLLYASGFADRFKAQAYDAAFGALFVSFNTLAAKQYGVTLDLGERFQAYRTDAQTSQSAQSSASGLAGAASAAQSAAATVATAAGTVADAATSLWHQTMDAVTAKVQNYQNDDRQRAQGGGMSAGGWIVLALIALLLFGQSSRARRARWRAGGCGCSPIGWIVGGLGLGALFHRNWDRDGRDERQEWRNGERDWKEGFREERRNWQQNWKEERREERRRVWEDRHGPGCCGRPPRW